MWDVVFREQFTHLGKESERTTVAQFLAQQGLSLDEGLEYTIALFDGDQIVATGSLGGRILKCIAVADEYKSQGLAAKIVSSLLTEAYSRGRTHLFVYTKPENKAIFTDMGFYIIAEVPDQVVLLENRRNGICRFIQDINQNSSLDIPSAAVVVNCNPFTLGHRHLIEYAAACTPLLHIFVVWEDQSIFPSEARYHLVCEGVKHLANVLVHKGQDYIISDATFPSYFIKEMSDVVKTHARLDLEIFTRYIAPGLTINRRFVGEEPYCQVTATYNTIMKEVLPSRGIAVEVVPRLAAAGQPISASRVRKLIREGRWSEVKELVPQTTYEFLVSPVGTEIIQKIQTSGKKAE